MKPVQKKITGKHFMHKYCLQLQFQEGKQKSGISKKKSSTGYKSTFQVLHHQLCKFLTCRPSLFVDVMILTEGNLLYAKTVPE